MPEQHPENSEIEPLTRTQVLIAMGVTAVLLLMVAKIWLRIGSVMLLPVKYTTIALGQGIGLGIAITLASSLVYRIWAAYRHSADYYLNLVLKPLIWPDLIWLGLLPGLSEELLFRGVMLPALGLDLKALVFSSLFFGILHLSSFRQWAYVIWATIVGFILGLSVLETGNLLVPIAAHITTNLISGSLWKWGDRTSPE